MIASRVLERFRRGLDDRSPGGELLRHPAQYIVVTFLAASLTGTLLLSSPVATRSGEGASFTTALFTATSATCVTGLVVVDTAGHWSGFGQAVILALIQVGGLGIMTLSSLVVLILSRRLGIRQRLIAAAQARSLRLGDVRSLLIAVIKMTIAVETAVAIVLLLRFWLADDTSVGRAAVLAVFPLEWQLREARPWTSVARPAAIGPAV